MRDYGYDCLRAWLFACLTACVAACVPARVVVYLRSFIKKKIYGQSPKRQQMVFCILALLRYFMMVAMIRDLSLSLRDLRRPMRDLRQPLTGLKQAQPHAQWFQMI